MDFSSWFDSIPDISNMENLRKKKAVFQNPSTYGIIESVYSMKKIWKR